MDNLKSVIKAYEKFVESNPDTISDLETTTKWVSYFIAGRITKSTVLSELVYSLSNMLVLYNDRILERTRLRYADAETQGMQQNDNNDNTICNRLKVMLTVLEYSEVFVEISAQRIFGAKGKWTFVTLLQLIKVSARYYILKYSIEHIVTTPAMPVLNRRVLILKKKSLNSQSDTPTTSKQFRVEHDFTFELKRSGRVVRKVEGAPPLQYREFKLQSEVYSRRKSAMPAALLQAEYLYIAKPLIHLAAMGVFGQKNWKQYVLALAMDIASIRLYHKNRRYMSKEQKLEMSRRCINLLLYIMRSPFYERFTQSRLDGFLSFLANNVPIIKLVVAPLRDYIPHWQSTYFYLWST